MSPTIGLPPPEPEICLVHSRASRFKGGTVVDDEVRDVETHERRVRERDGYRPDACPRCAHPVLHVHSYRERRPRPEPGCRRSSGSCSTFVRARTAARRGACCRCFSRDTCGGCGRPSSVRLRRRTSRARRTHRSFRTRHANGSARGAGPIARSGPDTPTVAREGGAIPPLWCVAPSKLPDVDDRAAVPTVRVALADLGERLGALRVREPAAVEAMRRSLSLHRQLTSILVFAAGDRLEILDGFKRVHAARHARVERPRCRDQRRRDRRRQSPDRRAPRGSRAHRDRGGVARPIALSRGWAVAARDRAPSFTAQELGMPASAARRGARSDDSSRRPARAPRAARRRGPCRRCPVATSERRRRSSSVAG
jgi:hypothetical protein